MITVSLFGGLGNQLYQYALYRRYQEDGKNACISLAYYDSKIAQNAVSHGQRFVLNDVFAKLKIKYANENEENRVRRLCNSRFSRLLATKNLLPYYIVEDVRNEKTTYHPNILKIDNGIVHGYWQSPYYFKSIMDTLKKELIFRGKLDKKNSELAEVIRTTESVSVHVRRGDYLASTSSYEILGMDYYKKAIETIYSFTKKPIFFVFSDDIKWCKNNFKFDCFYIDWNNGKNSHIDMQLMSLCKHNIIANSTFSIWGALLNSHCAKKVIHPYKYTSGKIQKRNRWCDEWIEIVY